MKIAYVILATAVAAAATTTAARAQSPAELLQSNGCAGCHAADAKLVGPSYHDIAAKYRGDKGAEAKLAAKVKAGGSGVWGAIPMPPNPQVKDDDLKKIVTFILASK
jgi:cytochrome c